MTDLFSQQGINFQASSMASTHPTATPAAIEAPKVNLDDAPANQTIPVQNSGNSQTSAPQQAPQSLAGDGSEGAAPAGAAPPQPAANSGVDLFAQQGIKADSLQQINGNAFDSGTTIPANAPPTPEVSSLGKDGKPIISPVGYAQNQMAQDAQLSQSLFTAEELQTFKDNPIQWSEAAARTNDYDAAKFAPLQEKVQNNQPLTPAETDQLKQWAKDTVEVNIRGLSWGGKTAYVGLQVPQWIKQAIGASDTASDNAPILGQGISLPAPYTAQYGETQLNGISAITDKGQMILNGADKAPAKSALQSLGHTVLPSDSWLDKTANFLSSTNPPLSAVTTQPNKAAAADDYLGELSNVLSSTNPGAKQDPVLKDAADKFNKLTDQQQTAGIAAIKELGTAKYWDDLFNQPLVPPAQRAQEDAQIKAQSNGDFWHDLRVQVENRSPGAVQAAMKTPGGKVFQAIAAIPGANQIFAAVNNYGAPEVAKQLGTNPDTVMAVAMIFGAGREALHGAGEIGKLRSTTYYDTSTPITAAAKDLPPTVTLPLYNALKAVDPKATVSKLLTSAGWNGMLDKLGPDQVQQILGNTLEKDGQQPQTYDDFMKALVPDKDQKMVEGGLISIADGQHASTSIVSNLLQEKGMAASQAQETVGNMSALEKDAYVQQNLQLPKSATPTLADPDLSKPAQPVLLPDAPQGADGAANIIAGGAREAHVADPALIQDKNSNFNQVFKNSKIYAEMWNDLQPIENLGKEARAKGAPIADSELSPAQLSLAKSTPEYIVRQWTTGTTSWDREGNQVETGKGLKQIGDDFDNLAQKIEPNRKARNQDITAFRKAMTFIEDKTKGYGNVSDKDFNESQASLSRLRDKYGDNMKWFENTAKEYRDFDNRILHNLVTSGLKTQAWYDDLVGKREWYAPTNRVVESEYPEDVAATVGKGRQGKGLGADVNPKNIGALKERKGSEREVIDPVQSSMRNSAIIIKRSMLNKVRGDVAKYAEYFPEKVKVKPPAIIREAVEHSYDPKLRIKLEQMVEALGGQVERVKNGEKIGDSKRNLGAYEPSTRKTYLRPGTTEGTFTHEGGHMLDHLYDLKEKLSKNEKMKGELEKLAEDRLRSKITLERTPEGKTAFAEAFDRNPKKYVDYVKNGDEVIANFFDSWVNSPEQTERIAPTVKAAFEKFIDETPDLAMLKQLEPSTQRATETIQKALLDFKGPKDSVPFYQNGRLMFLHLDPDIAQAFNGLDQIQGAVTTNFLKTIGKAQARALQFGATNNPYFIARHFLRGAQSSYVNTAAGGIGGFFRHFAVEIPKGIAAVIGKTDAYREWASSSGALRTFMDTSTEGIEKMHDKIFNKGDMAEFLNPKNWAELTKDFMTDQSGKSTGAGLLHVWQTAKEVSDYAPRIAAYERLKDAGYSDLEAGFLSLEATGNYIRHGNTIKNWNQYSPFLNDRMQGADRFLRAIKRDPAGYAVRAVALITAPQLIVTGYYLFAADDETRKEYLNLSDFRRGAAMNIKIGGQWIPFPRAFAPGYVFGAIPEQMMIHYSQKAHPELKRFWLNMLGDAVNSLSPSTDWTQTIPPVLKAMLESQTNFSFYRNQPIFHGDREKTAPENQFNANTSESAKALGKLLGVSPANIDNTAYDMSAHIGVYAQQLSDYVMHTQQRAAGELVNEKPTKGSDNPLYGPMMQPKPVGTASESFQEFHEHETDLSQQHNRDKEAVGKDKADFEKDNHQDIALYPTIARANTEVMHEEHEIRLITENPHFTGDQKAQQIAQHQQRIEQIVEGANSVYHNVKDKK